MRDEKRALGASTGRHLQTDFSDYEEEDEDEEDVHKTKQAMVRFNAIEIMRRELA